MGYMLALQVGLATNLLRRSMQYQAYVLYDARSNIALSYCNMTRDEAQRINKLIPTHNFSHPWLIWILLPAWHETMRR